MRVLVTGGSGYLGSHVCLELKNMGHEILVLDLKALPECKLLHGVKFTQCDITDEKALAPAFKNFSPDVVIHLAAVATVGACEDSPDICQQVNVEATGKILKAMKDHEIDKIIFASSCAVYKDKGLLPFKESDELEASTVYGSSKLEAEKLIRSAEGISSVIFRLFNIAGADESGELGEDHEPETHIIPLTIEAAVKGKQFCINGDEFPTEDGSTVRDYIHVTDAAIAFAKAAEYLSQNKGGLVANLGSGIPVSVKQVVERVGRVTFKKIDVVVNSPRKGDSPYLLADKTLLNEALGVSLKHSEMENIIASAYKWHSKKY